MNNLRTIEHIRMLVQCIMEQKLPLLWPRINNEDSRTVNIRR